jgi:hypothetical protein
MKPFNLKNAIAGKLLQTRDGKEVTDFKFFPSRNFKFNCAAIIDGEVFWFNEKGRHNTSCNSNFDLFMREEKLVLYANLFECGEEYYVTSEDVYETKKEAESEGQCLEHYVCTFPITINR